MSSSFPCSGPNDLPLRVARRPALPAEPSRLAAALAHHRDRRGRGDGRRASGVDAAAPFVLTQGLISAGHDYAEGVVVYGVDPDTGRRAVTSFARHFTKGDLTFKTTHADVEGGIALGTRLASKL